METVIKIALSLFVLLLIILIIVVILDWYWPYTPPPEIDALKEQLSKVDPKFGQYDIRENSKESYTKRSSRIFLCLRNPETKAIYDNNVLMYVALHECAHVLSPGAGHNAEFQKTFSILLHRAEKAGVYDSKVPFPKRYCGKNF